MKEHHNKQRNFTLQMTFLTSKVILLLLTLTGVGAFTPTAPLVARKILSQLCSSSDSDRSQPASQLSKLMKIAQIETLEKEFQRPPNSALSAEETVRAVLDGLLKNDDPLPNSGFRLLLRASTKSWREKLHASIGVPHSSTTRATEEVVAEALHDAMSRPNNQFAILVGIGESYRLEFSTSEELDLGDTCWVVCQIRHLVTNELLVMLGWQLEARNDYDNAWLVDGLEWQDFRENFRPGIGREEWERICG